MFLMRNIFLVLFKGFARKSREFSNYFASLRYSVETFLSENNLTNLLNKTCRMPVSSSDSGAEVQTKPLARCRWGGKFEI